VGLCHAIETVIIRVKIIKIQWRSLFVMWLVCQMVWAVAEVPVDSGSGSVAVAVAGACSGVGCSDCCCYFRCHHCKEAVTNAVVVCGQYLLPFFRFQRLHLHGVDVFVAGVAIARSAHPVSAADAAAAADVLLVDDSRSDHSAEAGVFVAAPAPAVVGVGAADVVHAFVVDDGAAVGVGPLTSPAVDASVAHAVHAALPSADHVTQSVVPLVSC